MGKLLAAAAFNLTVLLLMGLVHRTPAAFAAERFLDHFHDESEIGIALASGNASTQSYNFRQLNTWRAGPNTYRFDGAYLSASSRSVDLARNWLLGLRYEHVFTGNLSGYLAETLMGDIFAGYLQRYNSDVGAKYYFVKEEALYVFGEAGYRYMIENRRTGQLDQHLLRVAAEASRSWTKTTSLKLGLEYLPNLTVSSDYQLNFGISVDAAISEIFALKVGYALRFRKIPVAPATEQTDTQFTTALVAKFGA